MPGIRELGCFYRFTNTSLGKKLVCWDGNAFDTTKHKYQDVHCCLSERYFLEERILILTPPILSSHRPWHQPCMWIPTLLTTDLSCTVVPCSSYGLFSITRAAFHADHTVSSSWLHFSIVQHPSPHHLLSLLLYMQRAFKCFAKCPYHR